MTWYHGSQQELTVLMVGSSITESEPIARAFSHRPSVVSVDDDGAVKHTGSVPGYLYEVAEEVGETDIFPHPHPINQDGWEWVTTRALCLRLLEQTIPRPGDVLSAVELADRQWRVMKSGQTGSAILRDFDDS